MTRLLCALLLVLVGCTNDLTPRLDALDLKLSGLEHNYEVLLEVVEAWATACPPTATPGAIPTETTTPAATPTRTAIPVWPTATATVQMLKPKCSRCAVFGELCNEGLVCASCGSLGFRCVVPNAQGCAECASGAEVAPTSMPLCQSCTEVDCPTGYVCLTGAIGTRCVRVESAAEDYALCEAWFGVIMHLEAQQSASAPSDGPSARVWARAWATEVTP